jgi:hypothetical protein
VCISALVPTASGRFARQQQTFARPPLPEPVPDPVLLSVLSCPFYGGTPILAFSGVWMPWNTWPSGFYLTGGRHKMLIRPVPKFGGYGAKRHGTVI